MVPPKKEDVTKPRVSGTFRQNQKHARFITLLPQPVSAAVSKNRTSLLRQNFEPPVSSSLPLREEPRRRLLLS